VVGKHIRKALAMNRGEWRPAFSAFRARYASPIQSVMQLGMSRLIPIAVGILSFPLLAKLLQPGDYGRLTLLVSVATLSSAAAGSWLSSALLRYYTAPAEPEERAAIEAWSYFRALPASILVAVAAVVAVSFAYPVGFLPYAAACAVVAAQMAYAIYTAVLQAKLRFQAGLVVEALKGGFYAILLVAFVALFHGGIVGALLAAALSAVLAIVVPVIREPVPFRVRHHGYARKFLIYGVPLMASSICSWIIQLSDRWFLVAHFNEHVVGAYAANYSLVEFLVKNPATVVLQLVSLLIFRRFDATEDEAALARLRWYRPYMLAGSLVLALIPILFGQSLIGILASSAYRLQSSVQIILSIAQFFQAMAMFEGIALQIRYKTGTLLIAAVIAALANLTANALLIPVYGPLGAASATTIGYLVLWAAVLGGRWLVVERRRDAS
jgi:O-antigen/teichoic acid export membrane protein